MSSHFLAELLVIFMLMSCCSGDKSSRSAVHDIGCQHRSTHGRDYRGTANTTVSGNPCQKWVDTEFTYVGDHNYCREFDGHGMPIGQVWCFGEVLGFGFSLAEPCSVPFCPPLQVMDFSLDNDWKRDANNSYTFALLRKENLPPSFTVCTAFMVEQWGKYQTSPLFLILDPKSLPYQKTWLSVDLTAGLSQTRFTIHLAEVGLTVESSEIFTRLRWTRVCFSFDSNTSLAILVADGIQLVKRLIQAEPPKNQEEI